MYVGTNGKVVILNGALNVNGGTVSNAGTIQTVTIPLGIGSGFVNKYSEVVSLNAGSPQTIYHNLNTLDINVTCWDETTQEIVFLTIDRGGVNDITVISNTTLSSVRVVVNG